MSWLKDKNYCVDKKKFKCYVLLVDEDARWLKIKINTSNTNQIKTLDTWHNTL